MEKDHPANYWRRLGRLDKTFLLLVCLYVILWLTGLSQTTQSVVGVVAFLVAMVVLFRLARRGMRKAIWRLRNRLIVAYLFIAVVPIVLIMTLVGLTAWAVIGQIAIYLVNTELAHHEATLMRQAEALAHVPAADPERAVTRFAMMTRTAFPDFELLVKGQQEVRYPENARIESPPTAWKRASGLVVKKEGGQEKLFAWAHVIERGEEVTVLAPITPDVLAQMVPGLGEVYFLRLMRSSPESRVPPAASLFDFAAKGFYPIDVAQWDSPEHMSPQVLVVSTRASSVLSRVFQKLDWAAFALGLFAVVAVLFLLVELVSLVVGVQLTRSITGAVHLLYEGMQHVRDGDFSYRVPVKGSDQLAELTTTFNTMSQNLGRLMVVAKEKERMESELEIAREVQNGLFPKDVPYTKTLELRGVCHPARMVSGDYYDFLSLSDSALAIAIGDVAGKGISAALLMATIQSTMRTQLSTGNGAGHINLSPARMVANLNKQLYATTTPEKYATFYFALYEDANHTLSYTNAGHLAPILLRGNDVQMLGSTGTVVGAFPFARFEERTVSLDHGDVLVAYTDGIVEPENAYGEMFGEKRLQDLLVKYSRAESSELIARTMEAVNQWTGSSELQDDMTMVVARRV
jgi:sigma-B regulation protein RsbU (phosphoserine phosphatase)